MSESPPQPSRARAFSVLFLIEMWERFGYYGMQVLLVVFMIEYLGFTDRRANLTWGALAAMIYAVPVLGGWVGDRVLGARRTTLLGALVLCLGYLLLSVPWRLFVPHGWAEPLLFFCLGLIATGNGTFKANPSSLVSRMYEHEPSKLDGAFTMYYMAINIGALISQALTPWLRVRYGWHWAFLACAGGLVLGIVQLLLRGRLIGHIGTRPDFEPLRVGRLAAVLVGILILAVLIAIVVQNLAVARAIVWLAGLGLLALFAVLIARGGRSERAGLIAMLILTGETLLFFVFYQQISTSLTLFALHNVRLDFYGYSVPPEQFQVLDPFWIVVCSPLLALLYGRLGQHGRDLSIPGKYAWGFALLALAFFVYSLSGTHAAGARVSPWWMIGGYLLLSIAELLISGLALAMVSRYIGPERRGLMMGAWLLSMGLAQYIGSFVANFASVPIGITDPARTLALYTHLFRVLGWVAVGGLAASILLLPILRRLEARLGEARAPPASGAGAPPAGSA
ncbi:MAG: peptide MFS transporter [Steroidobacteraceae bacterium]